MTLKLSPELLEALRQSDEPLQVVDPTTNQVYVLVDHSTHQKAMAALQRQEADAAAVSRGISDMESGRSMTLEESKRKTEESLSRFGK